MAIKPTVFPRFATNDLNNGTGGAANVVEPGSAKKDTGWNEGERPARETFNWIHRINNDWNVYLDSIASPMEAAWQFQVAIAAADPGTNNVRFDNATLSNVQNMYFDDISSSGFDTGPWVARLRVGDILYVQKALDPAIYAVYRVAGIPVDNVGWWTVPVKIFITAGILPAANDTIIFAKGPNVEVPRTYPVTINTQRNNTVVYIDAAGLVAIPIVVGPVYLWEFTFKIATFAASDLKWRMKTNNGLVFGDALIWRAENDVNSIVANGLVVADVDVNIGGTDAATTRITGSGLIQASVSGDFDIEFSQQTAAVENTTFQTGSWGRLTVLP